MEPASFFCDNPDLLNLCSEIIARNLLGEDLLTKIKVRYEDLKSNFNSVSFDEWTPGGKYSLWKFSSGLTPYKDYDDTSIVPIPISNRLFKLNDAIVSFDFPVWFNMSNPESGKILIVSQDPISRSIKWYSDCRDALCTTLFGLHNPLWRNKGNGGKRIWLLMQRLILNGYGVYLTDCIKFAIQDTSGEAINPTEEQLQVYQDILKKEIDAVKPDIIVAFGNVASSTLSNFPTDNLQILSLPHFSGLSQGKIREYFNWDNEKTFTIEEQATCFFNVITQALNKD